MAAMLLTLGRKSPFRRPGARALPETCIFATRETGEIVQGPYLK